MDPDEVTWITPSVAITNFVSAHHKDLLAALGVQAVLCLDRELEGEPAAGRRLGCVAVVHLIDGANDRATFRGAVDCLERLVAEHGRVVVHCRAGRSRSIAVVAAYLRKSQGSSADEAFAAVGAKRLSAVAPELVELVEDFEA